MSHPACPARAARPDRVQRNRRPRGRQLGLSAPGPRPERGGQEELHFGVGAHDRAGVAPLEDDTTRGRQLLLQRRDLRAHRRERRNVRGDLGHLPAPDGFGHVLAVEKDVPGGHHDRARRQMVPELRPFPGGDPRSHDAQRQGAVHRAGGHQRVAKPLGQESGCGALSRTRRPIDRDHRLPSCHQSSTRTTRVPASVLSVAAN